MVAELVAWVTEAVDAAGRGPVRDTAVFRDRPWGTIIAVEVPDGRLYAKAPDAKRRFEAAVTPVVASVAPTLAPTVLAADEARGWLLLGDHGEPIADALEPAEQVDAIRSLLAAYGAAQSATVSHVESWIAAGMPDRRVDRVAAQFEAFLDGSPHRELIHECGPFVPVLAEVCAELAASPTPDALDHADIHGTNVVFDGHDVRLIDWGDACVTHPFCSLAVPSQLVVPELPVSRRAAADRSLRDAYLEPWGGPTAGNVRLVVLAMWLGSIVRVLSLAEEDDTDDEIAEVLADWVRCAPDR